MSTGIGRVNKLIYLLPIQEKGQLAALCHNSQGNVCLGIVLEGWQQRRLSWELLEQGKMFIRSEIMVSIKTNIKIIEVALLKIAPKEESTTISVKNLHMYFKGHIAACCLLWGCGTERINVGLIRASVISLLLEEAEAIGELIIGQALPHTRLVKRIGEAEGRHSRGIRIGIGVYWCG